MTDSSGSNTHKRFFVIYFIVLLCVIGCSFFAYYTSKASIRTEVSEATQQTVDQLVQRMDMELNLVSQMLGQVNFNPQLREQISRIDQRFDQSDINIMQKKQITNILDTIRSSNKHVYMLRVVSIPSAERIFETNGSTIGTIGFSFSSSGEIVPGFSYDDQNKRLLQQIKRIKADYWKSTLLNGWLKRQDLNPDNIRDYTGPMITLFTPYTNIKTGAGEALVLVAEIRMSMLTSLFEKTQFPENSSQLIVDDQDLVVYSKHAELMAKPWVRTEMINPTMPLQFVNMDGKEYMVVIGKSGENGWKFVDMVPTERLFADVNYTLWVSVASLVLLAAISVMTMVMFRRFYRLNQTLQHTADDLRLNNQQLEITKDELSIINKVLERQSNELIKLNAIKDQIMANTSHELRTPLNGIIGIAESMVEGVSGTLNDLASRNLTMIIASGRRLLNLVNDILDFAKIRNRTLPLKIKLVVVRDPIEQCVKLLEPLFIQKKIALQIEIPAQLPKVPLDEDRFQQMLQNLVSNALKFTEQGRVVIRARATDQHVYIDVEDTGIGILEEYQMRIFKAFEQVDGSSQRKFSGTGLGLSITKQLVEMHKGTIDVRSTYGLGSCFTLCFPLQQEALVSDVEADNHPAFVHRSVDYERLAMSFSPMEIPQNPADELTQRARMQILVVDDEPINLQVIINHLSNQPYEVIPVSSGQEAIKRIEGGLVPDLILLDVMMPELNGYEVTKRIRWRYPIHRLPIILLTAKTQTEDLVDAFDVGANDFLTKPIQKYELLARMKTHLQLANWSESMQLAVDERTRAVRALLDRSEQGFLTVNPKLLVQNEYSLACEQIFMRNIDTVEFTELIYPDQPEQAASVRAVLQTIFDQPDAANVSVMMGLLPEELQWKDRSLMVRYQLLPVIMGIEPQLLVIVTDVTDAMKLAERVKLEQAQLKRVVYAVSHEHEVTHLIRTYHQFARLDWVGPGEGQSVQEWAVFMMRTIHTFKGHFMQIRFEHAAKQLSEIEDVLSGLISSEEPSREWVCGWMKDQPILSIMDREMDQLVRLLGNHSLLNEPLVKVPREAFVRTERMLRASWSPATQQMLIENIQRMYFLPVTDIVSRYERYVMELAERRERAVPIMTFTGDPFLIHPDTYQMFSDSLIHVYRNIVEHGLESVEERDRIGKATESRIHVTFERMQGGGFRMTIQDDGRGIDTGKLRKVLFVQGLFDRGTLQSMSEEEIWGMIFRDNVSTSDQTNDLAGRGAGLAAVKQCTEEAGGKVSVSSIPSQGTTFCFEFPSAEMIDSGSPVEVG